MDVFDLGATGYIKKVNGYAIREGLDSKSIVLLPHLGISSGEALSCEYVKFCEFFECETKGLGLFFFFFFFFWEFHFLLL